MLKSKDEREIVSAVYGMFEEYRSAYGSEWERLDESERYYRGKHWEEPEDPNEPQPVTPIIHSAVENLAADLMDNYPEAIITAESPEDEPIARVVQELIAQNHDAASYVREYRKLAHDLLVGGYAVQEVGYDTTLHNGIGGAFIRHINARNVMVDPLCSDIQDGRAIIKIEGLPRKILEQQYPDIEFESDRYSADVLQDDPSVTRDATKMVLKLEYWWRERRGGASSVHMCKIAGGKLLEDSRRQKPEGYYAHGQYPFVITPLFIRKGSPLGWGLVDMLKDRQKTADKLDQFMLINAYMSRQNKILITENSGFDEGELADWSKSIHKGNSLNGIQWFPTPPLPQYLMAYIQGIRQNVKEESGANDFSRGNVAGGVTAASAIAALQEMSSKRSRMAAAQLHEAYKDAVRMEIEVEREFNLLPREVLVTVDGERRKETFESAMLQKETELGNHIPIEFAISIKVQRENKWSVLAQNELVLQMVQLQVIRPDQALELMHFEGKESIIQRAAQAQPDPHQTQEAQAQIQKQAMKNEMQSQIQQMPAPEEVLA